MQHLRILGIEMLPKMFVITDSLGVDTRLVLLYLYVLLGPNDLAMSLPRFVNHHNDAGTYHTFNCLVIVP